MEPPISPGAAAADVVTPAFLGVVTGSHLPFQVVVL